MNWLVQRYISVLINNGTSQGLLFEKVNGESKWFCHTLEDESRPDQKVAQETRIRAGLYEMKIRKEDTKLTVKHRLDYGAWFKYHIEIITPDFVGTYVHAGVDQSHTAGCLLLMDTMGNCNIDVKQQGSRSTQAVRRFYEKVYAHLAAGNRAWIEFRDEAVFK